MPLQRLLNWNCPRCICAIIFVLLGHGTAAEAQRQISLKQAYALALRHNPSLRMLQHQVELARANLSKAWSAVKPSASFQGTFTHYNQEIVLDPAMFSPAPITPAPPPIVIQKQNQFDFNIAAVMPLFRGPAYPGISLARKQVESTRLSSIRSRNDFLLMVAQAYYLVVSQEEVVKALEHKVAINEKHLAAAKARFQVGQAPRAEFLRADLVATQDEQRLRSQRNNLKAARRQLAILLGVKEQIAVQRPAEPGSPEVARGIGSTLEQRKDYRASVIGEAAARQGKNAVWWGFLPALDLTWLYRWSEVTGFAGNKDSWQLFLTLTVPIYDGGVRYANLRSAKAQLRQAQDSRLALAQKIESDVVRLQSEVESANAGVVSARKALELAKTTAADIDASFAAGAASQLDVLDANQRLLDAELGLTSSLFTRALARLALSHALGQFHPKGG